MASSASSTTRYPPSKTRQTNIIDVSSNESSPIHEPTNNRTTMISITLALSITPPNARQTLPSQPIEPSPLAPRALIFFSPPTSPHLYLDNIKDLPPRSLNPPPFPSLDQINNQNFPYSDLMEYEPFFPPTNLSRRGNRLCAQPKPSMTREQIIKELRKLQDLSNDIETTLYNAQNGPHTTTTTTMPPPPSSLHPTTISTTTIPPFRPHLPPSQTPIHIDQSLWIDAPSSISPYQEQICPHCQRTHIFLHEVQDEMRFMLNHILERLTRLANQKP
uniref:Uncharacterized protein n=1 Tax=Tanacetum cinerariifolium TaxID=118510 RepID=A0A6L2MVN1_TANCI|nr:hypothetical protein [Tanacetum cinerariifolium]